MKYASELIRFISSIPVLIDGTVPMNRTDEDNPFVSQLYTPTYSLSTISRLVQNLLVSGKIEVVEAETDGTTIVHRAFNSNLASAYPRIYLLLRIAVLESFSILYMIDNDPIQLQYVSKRDILRARENLNYLADFFGTKPAYYSFIENMRDMNISLGYLENQIEVIMDEKGVR